MKTMRACWVAAAVGLSSLIGCYAEPTSGPMSMVEVSATRILTFGGSGVSHEAPVSVYIGRVDGQFTSAAPSRVAVTPGPHEIRVEMAGGGDAVNATHDFSPPAVYYIKIQLADGEPARYSVSTEPPEFDY